MRSKIGIWLNVVLAWKNIQTVPQIKARIDAMSNGNSEEDSKRREHYRRVLRSHESMIICLPLAEGPAGIPVNLEDIARIVADDPSDPEDCGRARKRIISVESRRKLGEKAKVIDVLEAMGILEVTRPEKRGSTYMIQMTKDGRTFIESIVPDDDLRGLSACA